MNSKLKVQGSRLPFVLVNMAMTADGKIATANRAVSSFGSARDREHMFGLRATADAVMTGARTVNSAPVNLGPGPGRFRRLRLQNGLAEHNLRVVASGSGQVNPQAEIFKHRFSPIIVLTTRRASPARMRRLRGVADAVKVCGKDRINLRAALGWLTAKWGVKRLLCEGGGELNAALFQAGLVHELHLTVCPKVLGGRAAPTIAEGSGVQRLAEATLLQRKSLKRFGNELFVVFTVRGKRQ